MLKRLGGLLFSLPVLIGAGVSVAATTQPSLDGASVSAPAPDHAAMPTGCNGCAGHDCANCPLMRAAAEQSATQPAPSTEIHCGTN